MHKPLSVFEFLKLPPEEMRSSNFYASPHSKEYPSPTKKQWEKIIEKLGEMPESSKRVRGGGVIFGANISKYEFHITEDTPEHISIQKQWWCATKSLAVFQ